MIVFIVAGGSGTRLWPLSTPSYPKHLLKVNSDKTLIQNTLERAKMLTDESSIYVYTESSHVDHVKKQLKDFEQSHILVEPARRGTANCVLYALQFLKKKGIPKNEAVALIWADHVIRDARGFADTFKRAAGASEKHGRVVFIGAEPANPSTAFGYIEHGSDYDGEKQIFEFKDFHEKPDKDTAEKYLETGRYLWNMGYMVTTTAAFEAAAQKYSPDFYEGYQKLLNSTEKDFEKVYLSLKNDAIDYAFSEKLREALVMPGSFDWIDVGSYSDLHAISFQDSEGNYVNGAKIATENVTNSYINNETETPIAVVGLDNVVVINSPNGILVINKNFSQKVKDVANKLSEAS